jgi:hypothetical protein
LDSLSGPLLAEYHVKPTKDWVIEEIPLKPVAGIHDMYVVYTSTEIKNPNETAMIFDYLHPTKKFPNDDVKFKKDFWELLKSPVPTTPIMIDNTRSMNRLPRYLNEVIGYLRKILLTSEYPNYFLHLPQIREID